MKKSYTNLTKEDHLELIKKRYDKVKDSIPLTVARLNKDKQFKKIYPDWLLYSAITQIAINYRVNYKLSGLDHTFEDFNKYFKYYMNQKETKYDIEVPLSEFTEIKFIEGIISSIIISFLHNEGFEVRRRTPNMVSLKKFAIEELDYIKYDIPHDQWFDN